MAEPYFRVHRSQLAPALKAASEAADSRATIPVLANILLKPQGDQLLLRGTDLSIEIEASCDLLAEGSGMALTIKAADLRDIVNSLPETAEISILPGRHHGQVQIRADRARFSIGYLPESDFPSISTALEADPFETDIARFCEALGKVSYAALKIDTGHTYLMGVHVRPSDDGSRIDFVATDGSRCMGLVRVPTNGDARFDGIILPLKTAQVIQKLFGAATRTAQISIGRNLIRVECNGVSLFSRLIDGIFPKNYLQIIPPDPQSEAVMTVENLRAAVKRVSLVGTELDKDSIFVSLGEGAMRVELSSKDGEQAADSLPIEYDGDDGFETGLNCKILLETLASIATQDMRVSFGGTPANVVFRPIAEGFDETFVIAPIRPKVI